MPVDASLQRRIIMARSESTRDSSGSLMEMGSPCSSRLSSRRRGWKLARRKRKKRWKSRSEKVFMSAAARWMASSTLPVRGMVAPSYAWSLTRRYAVTTGSNAASKMSPARACSAMLMSA
eukprot:1885575-Rhodomonas_salina.1